MPRTVATFLVSLILSGVVRAQAPVLTNINPGFGFAGTRVELTGTNLQDAQIIFGSETEAVEVGREGSTRIIVRAPENPLSHPGLAEVRARRDAVWSNALTFLYLAEQTAAPAIYRLSQSCAVIGHEGPIQIEGDYFSSQMRVDFGSLQAEVSVIDPRRLAVVVPPGQTEQDVDIVVTNVLTNRSTRLPRAFNYVALAPPAIGTITPDPAVVGFVLRVRGSGFIQGATTVHLDEIELARDQVTVENCNELHVEVPESTPGRVRLTITTPAGLAEGDISVEEPPAAAEGCRLGTWEVEPGREVEEFYGRRWREAETSAFHRGEFGAGRVWMRVIPQCQGAPPILPQLKLRVQGTSDYTPARDCNPDPVGCLPNQGRSFELRDFGPFQEPKDLDVQFRCSNGITMDRLNFFSLYVGPRQMTDRFTEPAIVAPGGEVEIRARDLVQQGKIVAPQRVKLFVREGLPSDHRIVWWRDFTGSEICFRDLPLSCLDSPVRIEREGGDPRLYVVRVRIPNVPNVIGRDLFVSLISERSDCRTVYVDQSSFPTLLAHVRSPGSFDLSVEPDTPIHFRPTDPDGTTITKTLRMTRQPGPDRYAGDVKVEATLDSPVSLNLELSITGGRQEEYCRAPECTVIYFSPQASETSLTLSVRKTGPLPLGTTRASVRVRATYPPREAQFTHEKLIDLYISPNLGLSPPNNSYLREGRVGIEYEDTQIQAEAGAPGYRWYFCGSTVPAPPVPSDCLPDGLTIQLLESSARVRIYGTPSLPSGVNEQEKSFQVRVVDQAGAERTATYRIVTRRAYIESFQVLEPRTRTVHTACGSPPAQVYALQITTRNFDLVSAGQRQINFTVLEPAGATLDVYQIQAPTSGSTTINLTVPASFIASHPGTAWNIRVRASGSIIPNTDTNPSGSLTINASHRKCLNPSCTCVEGAGVDECTWEGACRLKCTTDPHRCAAFQESGPNLCASIGPSRSCCLDYCEQMREACISGCPPHGREHDWCVGDCGQSYGNCTYNCPP